MRIIQIMNTLSYGAALTTDALNLQKILQSCGCPTQIYANVIGHGLSQNCAMSFDKIGNIDKNDIIIFHPNLRAKEFTYRVSQLSGRKIIRHHIFTPAEFSYRYSDDIISAVSEGNRALKRVQSDFEYILAPSRFDLEETRKIGFQTQKASIIPYLVNAKSYQNEKDVSVKIISELADEYTNILYVSRIVPNKKQEDAIAAFAYYKKNFNNKARLILPGHIVYKKYYERLKAYCDYLELSNQDVIFAGEVSFSDILSYYQIADIFLFSSEHEGCGIPLIEAMLFDIPIIAYNYTAISDTLGGCGVLLDSKMPQLTAYWIDRLTKDYELRNRIIQEYPRVTNQYSIDSVGDSLLIGLGTYIKSILNELPQNEYICAMNILSKFDLATAGKIWGEE